MKTNTIKRILRYIIKGVPVKNIRISINHVLSADRLANKSIIVTGGSKGIGYHIAKQAINEGANVLICARNKENLLKAQRELGNSCKVIELNFRK